MGSYEVLEQSNAMFLFKNQLLKNREDYKEKTSFNKWFFGNGSDLDLGYDIPKKNWDRIKLSGWNLGYMAPQGFRPQVQKWHPVNQHKSIDLSAIYSADHPPSSDHMLKMVRITMKHRLVLGKLLVMIPPIHFVKTNYLIKNIYNLCINLKWLGFTFWSR